MATFNKLAFGKVGFGNLYITNIKQNGLCKYMLFQNYVLHVEHKQDNRVFHIPSKQSLKNDNITFFHIAIKLRSAILLFMQKSYTSREIPPFLYVSQIYRLFLAGKIKNKRALMMNLEDWPNRFLTSFTFVRFTFS